MQAPPNSPSRKHPVNFILTEDGVTQARRLTPNLSGVVETLLTEFVEQEKQRRCEPSQRIAVTTAVWNAFDERHGGFATDYSIL